MYEKSIVPKTTPKMTAYLPCNDDDRRRNIIEPIDILFAEVKRELEQYESMKRVEEENKRSVELLNEELKLYAKRKRGKVAC